MLRRVLRRGELWLAALTVLCAPLAYSVMYTGHQVYDDEGYFTLGIKQVLAGHPLYHDVLSQYGPFFFEFWGTAFGFGSSHVSIDVARGYVFLLWLIVAYVCGVATLYFTRRLAPAAAVLLAVVIVNLSFAPEPTHPGSLLVLLLSLMALLLSLRQRLPATRMWAILGVLVGLMIMVKINVGGLAAISLLFGAACSCSATGRMRWLQLAAGGLMIVVPVALTSADLGTVGVQAFAGLVALSAAAVVTVALPRPGAPGLPGAQVVRPLLLGAAGAVVVTALVAWVALGAGPGTVFDQVVIKAANQRNVLSRLIDLRLELLDWALLSVVTAFALRRTRTLERLAVSDHPALAGVRLLVGATIIISVIGGSPLTFGIPVTIIGLATPLVWVAALPRPGLDAPGLAARAGVAALAVLQPLHGYPVAGSQLRFGAVLLLVAGGLCLGDGLALLEQRSRREPANDLLRFASIAALGLVIAFAAKIAIEQVGADTQSEYDARKTLTTLPFVGASRVDLSPGEVQNYTALVDQIRARCSTLQSFPGLGTLNLWSHVDPPTGLNGNYWPWLLDAGQQRRVVAALKRASRPCLVRNTGLQASLTAATPPDGPLVRYLSQGWTTRFSVGGYDLQTPTRQSS